MSGEKILIIDDKEFCEELGQTLLSCEYDVKVVSNSANVLELACAMKPNLILLDLRMSGSNGFLVAQNLKDTKETSNIPIIAMSGHFLIDDRRNLLDMHNMDGRIKKPFGVSDLISEIELVLAKGGPGRGIVALA
jgi:CheY-like chemotaxis protein